ncbi:MAG TPA: thiol:disulfide interchange protein DsbA/DsbL [Gammaproteobacteria bacterium]|jgi:thiol:disulfide interchange protein DsbA|nr:thiol:disulfide interchange protein DsbA/DsbL [Gammaproteobacteria bacterium]
MKNAFAILMLAVTVFAFPQMAAADQPEAGVNYQVLDTAQPTSAPAGKVEVIEFFWYACPHCFAFEPYLEDWLAYKPENVVFVRVPVVKGFQWADAMAHAYYTEKALGVVDKLHDAIFNEIHQKRHLLKSKEDFKAFFEQHGVSGEDFESAWNSFSVAMNVKRAANLQQAYRIMGVPTVAVGGRYTATLHAGQGIEDLPDVIDYLVKKAASE